jgi:hypothetical protein
MPAPARTAATPPDRSALDFPSGVRVAVDVDPYSFV